eukprot:Nk52_evm2s389 gene=Nk52_evmTU2s389
MEGERIIRYSGGGRGGLEGEEDSGSGANGGECGSPVKKVKRAGGVGGAGRQHGGGEEEEGEDREGCVSQREMEDIVSVPSSVEGVLNAKNRNPKLQARVVGDCIKYFLYQRHLIPCPYLELVKMLKSLEEKCSPESETFKSLSFSGRRKYKKEIAALQSVVSGVESVVETFEEIVEEGQGNGGLKQSGSIFLLIGSSSSRPREAYLIDFSDVLRHEVHQGGVVGAMTKHCRSDDEEKFARNVVKEFVVHFSDLPYPAAVAASTKLCLLVNVQDNNKAMTDSSGNSEGLMMSPSVKSQTALLKRFKMRPDVGNVEMDGLAFRPIFKRTSIEKHIRIRYQGFKESDFTSNNEVLGTSLWYEASSNIPAYIPSDTVATTSEASESLDSLFE